MKQYEKEVVQYQLNQEKAVLKRLERQYEQALQDITHKINTLSNTIEMLQNAGNSDEFALSQARAKAYQRDYQEALKGQISGVLDKLHADEFETVQDYLNACYEDGFTGAMYQMHAQDVPIIVPIDQGAEVQAIQLETKLKNPLYEALAGGVDGMKKAIQSELTRGIAMGLGWDEIARNLSNTTKAPLAHAKTIARTEGHRIQEKAAYDAFQKAKSRGADVLKQWDSTLDGKTRDSHRRVDGELREDGKKFSNGLMYPGDPDGEAEEVVNCRCTMLPRARWALDEDELKTLQERAKFFGLENDKKKLQDFEEFKKNYLKAAESVENSGKSGIIEEKIKAFKQDLADGKIRTTISPQKQARHVWGSKEFEAYAEKLAKTNDRPAYLAEGLTNKELHELVKNKLGMGIIEMKKDGSFQEFFSVEQIVGYCYNKAQGKYVPTKRVQVKYSPRDGNIHIIPVKERV